MIAFYDLLLDLHKTPRALKTLNPKGVILGLHWDNGKENGNYYLGFRVQGPMISNSPFKGLNIRILVIIPIGRGGINHGSRVEPFFERTIQRHVSAP